MTGPASLAEALAQLQANLPHVAKGQRAKVEKDGRTLYTYDYADLADINAVLLPVMTALGLSFTSAPTTGPAGFVLHYRLLHVSGDDVQGEYPLPDPARYGPQDLGKAITYARRYALCAVTGLSPGGDDSDAAEVQHQPAPERKSRAVPDAQLDAEGRMTRAQAAAHDRLVKDTRPHERGRVQRGKVPPGDDPWAQDSPVDPERASALRAAAEDRPGSIMDGQHRAIELLLTNLRIDRSARDERRGLVMGLLRLEELESMTDLSAAQAATAIRLLQAELDAEKAEAR